MVPGPRICTVVLLLIWTSVTGCNTVPQRAFVPPVIPVVQQGHPNQGQEMASHFSVSSAPVAQNVIATPDTTLLAAVLQPAPPTPTPVPQLSSPKFSGELIASRFHTKGPGRLGKHFFTISVTGDRGAAEEVRQSVGTIMGYEGALNIPVNSLTDFRLIGRLIDHSKESVLESDVHNFEAKGGTVKAGFRHRLSSSENGSPFVGAEIGYSGGKHRFDNLDDGSNLFTTEDDFFTWAVELGGEATLTPYMSILLGVSVGNDFEESIEDVEPRLSVSSAIWLSPNFFVAPRVRLDLDEHVRYGIDVGFEF
jgi:hypothetical protein